MHSGIYPIWCKHIMNPFTFLINRVILSTLMFSAVYIQFYHILQIRTKRTYFRLLLQLNICKKEGGKYLKVQWVYWDNSRGHEYAVFLAKPGNTDQQKKLWIVSCIKIFSSQPMVICICHSHSFFKLTDPFNSFQHGAAGLYSS